MRRISWATVVVMAASLPLAAVAETSWDFVPAGTDELTGEKTRASVMIQDDHRNDRLRSIFLLTHDDAGNLIAVINLNNLDRLPPGNGDVSVSYRADGGELRKATAWKRDDVRTAYLQVSAEEARSLFQGSFLVLSVDQTGKRYRFPCDDEQAVELRKAVDTLIDSGGK